MINNESSRPGQFRRLPDQEICRRRAIDPMIGLCECLVEYPVECQYAVSFGDAYLCKRPPAKSAEVTLAKVIDEPITVRRSEGMPAICKPGHIPAALQTKTASAKLEAVLVGLGVPLPPSAIPINVELEDYAERLARALGLAQWKHRLFAEVVAAAERISVFEFTDALTEQRRTFGKLVDILAANGVLTERERNLILGFKYPDSRGV
jgi:hypothetical protein